MFLHESLTGLPGTKRDEFGNLRLKRDDDVRRRWVHAMRLGQKALAKTKLKDLLNWLRWGSETGVMWECTAEELFRLVARWEAANPNATPEHYGVQSPMGTSEQDALWKRAYMPSVCLRHRCKRCNTLFEIYSYRCKKCDGERFLFGEQEIHGPRGKGTYNFALIGADGYDIAAFALATRGKTRTIPIPTMTPLGM